MTEIGSWRRNPYGFYAKHVLRLKPLDPLDPDFGHAELGNTIHAVLHDFISHHMQEFHTPDAALHELLELGRVALASVADQPAIHATWWARFENSARWFVAEETRQRVLLRPVALETSGTWPITIMGTTYTMRGRPDRIDIGPEGLVISDYKTGAPPTDRQIEYGYEPQLPLLGLMAAQGAFATIGAHPVAALRYLRLKGRAEAPDTYKNIIEPQTRMTDARTLLEAMLQVFAAPQMPYLVAPQPRYILRYDDYRHLGRIDEWGAPGEAA
ncbi:MAG: PD-(D/E)XK nuclease family protein [Hyphomicrobium sp.]